MKKSILLLELIVCCSCVFAERVYVGGLYYNIDTANLTAEVTYEQLSSYGNYNSYYKISIPQSISYHGANYQVTSIGTEAFFCGYNLESISLPATIKSIGNKAFCSCVQLASMNIPDSVISIGESAFSGCTNLKYLTCGNSVENIGKRCFFNCSNLTSITISNSVTRIEDEAFSYCSRLTYLTIGESVSEIGYHTFKECNNLRSIKWLAKNFTNINENIIFDDNISEQITSFIFGENVEVIPSKLCRGMTNLSSIEIPNSVIEIETGAFEYCSGLLNVDIPNSVVAIGDGTFYQCSSLSSITIGSSVTNIGVSIFFNCSSLNNITVSNQNTKYDSRDNCNAIIETSTNTLMIGCKNTKILQSITYIGEGAFEGCSGLEEITIPNSVTSIGDYAFGSCYNLSSIEIPNSITSIGSYAFAACPQLTNIKIPNGVKNINEETFSGCIGLTCIVIPNSVSSIGIGAFFNCSCLTSLIIGNSVTSIGEAAFYGCSSLIEIINYSPKPQDINDYTFYDVDKIVCSLSVPKESANLYKKAAVWKEFTNIIGVEVPEGVIDINTGAKQSSKILDDGQILILRGDKTFTITGQKIK